MRQRSSMRPRPFVVACLAAALLMLSDGLPVVQATIPYYPYECPIGSGGTDFNGDANEGNSGVVFWDPRNGLWYSSNQGPNRFWGTWGDIPTPGDFNGDYIDDYAVFRPSTGTWLVSCSSVTPNCPAGTLTVPWGTAGDLPVPADYNNDETTDYGVWRPSNGSWYVRSGKTGATLVNGVAWGQFGDCPIAARLAATGPGPLQLNVWRPSSGVWYLGQLSGTGGSAFAFGTYGDIPFAPDIDGTGDGEPVVFRPSTGTWYSFYPNFSISWGQPGDIPAPRSTLLSQSSALSVYRPTTGLTYNCFIPLGTTCTGGTNTEGPSGSPGVVPIQGRGK